MFLCRYLLGKELARFILGDKNPAGFVDVWDISHEGDLDLKFLLKNGSTLMICELLQTDSFTVKKAIHPFHRIP